MLRLLDAVLASRELQPFTAGVLLTPDFIGLKACDAMLGPDKACNAVSHQLR